MQSFAGIWSKRHFLVIWILQLLCAVLVDIFSIISLIVLRDPSIYYSDTSFRGFDTDISTVVKGASIIVWVLLVMAAFTINSIISEIVLCAYGRLSPITVLVLSCIKTLIWATFFAFGIVATVIGGGNGVPLLVLGLVLMLTSIAQLFIGARYTHKMSRGLLSRGNYGQTYNPQVSNVKSGIPSKHESYKPAAYDPVYHAPSEMPSLPYGHEGDGSIRHSV